MRSREPAGTLAAPGIKGSKAREQLLDKGNNFDLSRYQSIHAEEFKMKEDPDGFQLLNKLDEETEQEALRQTDYQTRTRIERANQARQQSSIDPSQIDPSHK